MDGWTAQRGLGWRFVGRFDHRVTELTAGRPSEACRRPFVGRFDHRVTELTAGRPGDLCQQGLVGRFDHRVTELTAGRPTRPSDGPSSAGSITG
jgi:hypothetical protein